MVKKTTGKPRVGDGTPGPGRPKGCKNKMTQSAKEAFQHAFDSRGGAEGLAQWAEDNATDFYKLYARLIPVEQVGKDGSDLIPKGIVIRVVHGNDGG